MISSTTTLTDISKESSFRFDADYCTFQRNIQKETFCRFGEFFEIVNEDKVIPSELPERFFYAEIGNVTKEGEVFPVELCYEERSFETESLFTKIEKGDIISVKEGDILLSKVRPYLNKVVFISGEYKNIYFTNAFIHLRPKKMNKVLFYALRSIFHESINMIARQGKGYPTLKESDLYLLKFRQSVMSKLLENESAINRYISEEESKITELNKQLRKDVDIINSVFQKEFNFDYEEFERLKTHKRFNSCLLDFSGNIDLRYSAKFHRPAGEFVINELNRISNEKIKNYVEIPIVLGASISPSDFDPSGSVYYVSMATVKNNKIELDDTQLVSQKWSSLKKNRDKSLKKDDIVMARSGVSIGKVALVEKHISAICADFTMRIRLKNYNQLFAYYYFRSQYFQYLIEIYKKGVQNQNIFPNIIQEFPLPSISSDEQKRIANIISEEIDYQNKTLTTISDHRKQITDFMNRYI